MRIDVAEFITSLSKAIAVEWKEVGETLEISNSCEEACNSGEC